MKLRMDIIALTLAVSLGACGSESGDEKNAETSALSASQIAGFRQAATHGDVEAAYRLGLIYARGTGVAQDFTEAYGWLHEAAMQGYPKAQYFLGEMYVKGDGVAVDYVEALTWFWVATSLGDKYAQKRMRAMTTRISTKQLDQAKRKVDELWKNMPRDYMVIGKGAMH